MPKYSESAVPQCRQGPPGLLTLAHSVHGRAGNSSSEVQCVPGAPISGTLGSPKKKGTLQSFKPLPLLPCTYFIQFPQVSKLNELVEGCCNWLVKNCLTAAELP